MNENKNQTTSGAARPWPKECPWPDPEWGGKDYDWDEDQYEIAFMRLDEEAEDLLATKDYMDDLVEEGRLKEDYSLNPDYVEDRDPFDDGDGDDSDDDLDEVWEPEMGSDFWDEEKGFDFERWTYEFMYLIGVLKTGWGSPAEEIQELIGYTFVNENLLRQAFTRRSFAQLYGVGDAEQLELIGDAVVNTAVTREMAQQLTDVRIENPKAPFTSKYTEGDLSRIRARFVCKEHLAACARDLGLEKYVLLGEGEQMSDSVLEDTVEALVGAVAVDSGWNWTVLENVVDRLLTIQLESPSKLIHPSFYETFNAWHQKKFGCMPTYVIDRMRPGVKTNLGLGDYTCTIRFYVPENDKGIDVEQVLVLGGETRSKARELAAEMAYQFMMVNGLWMRIEDAGIVPDLENSINQLQELHQKGYVEEPQYHFEENTNDLLAYVWKCRCNCSGIEGKGHAARKVQAKKKAAFVVVVRLLKAAGACEPEWEDEMWDVALG